MSCCFGCDLPSVASTCFPPSWRRSAASRHLHQTTYFSTSHAEDELRSCIFRARKLRAWFTTARGPLLSFLRPFLTSPLHASNAHSTTYVLVTHVSLVVGMTPCPLPSHLQSHFNYKRVHEVDKGSFAVYPPAGCSFRAGLAVKTHSRSGGQDIEDGATSRANTMFDFFAMEKTRSCARGQLPSPLSLDLYDRSAHGFVGSITFQAPS